jgi:hypothetical protein
VVIRIRASADSLGVRSSPHKPFSRRRNRAAARTMEATTGTDFNRLLELRKPTNPQTTSPLFQLPAEIRRIIFQYMVTVGDRYFHLADPRGRQFSVTAWCRCMRNPLRVCQRMLFEIAPLRWRRRNMFFDSWEVFVRRLTQELPGSIRQKLSLYYMQDLHLTMKYFTWKTMSMIKIPCLHVWRASSTTLSLMHLTWSVLLSNMTARIIPRGLWRTEFNNVHCSSFARN